MEEAEDAYQKIVKDHSDSELHTEAQKRLTTVSDLKQKISTIDTTLQMAGLNNTVTCQDSRRVMDMLAENPVELMLLDLNMPNVDGHRLLDDVRLEHPDVPVIIVTGAVDVETALTARIMFEVAIV